jgi:hypothetical protein
MVHVGDVLIRRLLHNTAVVRLHLFGQNMDRYFHLHSSIGRSLQICSPRTHAQMEYITTGVGGRKVFLLIKY